MSTWPTWVTAGALLGLLVQLAIFSRRPAPRCWAAAGLALAGWGIAFSMLTALGGPGYWDDRLFGADPVLGCSEILEGLCVDAGPALGMWIAAVLLGCAWLVFEGVQSARDAWRGRKPQRGRVILGVWAVSAWALGASAAIGYYYAFAFWTFYGLLGLLGLLGLRAFLPGEKCGIWLGWLPAAVSFWAGSMAMLVFACRAVLGESAVLLARYGLYAATFWALSAALVLQGRRIRWVACGVVVALIGANGYFLLAAHRQKADFERWAEEMIAFNRSQCFVFPWLTELLVLEDRTLGKQGVHAPIILMNGREVSLEGRNISPSSPVWQQEADEILENLDRQFEQLHPNQVFPARITMQIDPSTRFADIAAVIGIPPKSGWVKAQFVFRSGWQAPLARPARSYLDLKQARCACFRPNTSQGAFAKPPRCWKSIPAASPQNDRPSGG
ncbi:MAG: hypothetical protein JXR96_08875, partial [Deltaproteobacteria bacterium]|nr:hypothetical protein [Deltaproteobacteria bacterium]